MKKLLFIAFLATSIANFAQTDRSFLEDQISTGIKNNNFEQSYIALAELESNFAMDNEILYKRIGLTFYAVNNQIEYKDYRTVKSAVKMIENNLSKFLGTDKAEKLGLMKTLLNFALVYYGDFSGQLTKEEKNKLIAETLKNAKILQHKKTGYEDRLKFIVNKLENNTY